MMAWVTWKEARQRVSAIWFLQLAVADLLCCLSPILAVSVAHRAAIARAVGCRTLPSVILLSMYASVLLPGHSQHGPLLAGPQAHLVGAAGRACRVLAVCGTCWGWPCCSLCSSGHPPPATRHSAPAGGVVDYVARNCGKFSDGRPVYFWLPGRWWSWSSAMVPSLCRGLPDAAGHWAWPAVVGLVCWAPYHALGLTLTLAAPHSTRAPALRAEPLVVGLALAHSCPQSRAFPLFWAGSASLCQLHVASPEGATE